MDKSISNQVRLCQLIQGNRISILYSYFPPPILYLNAYPEVTGIYWRFNKNSILDNSVKKEFCSFFGYIGEREDKILEFCLFNKFFSLNY
jgi:hypothetical protein